MTFHQFLHEVEIYTGNKNWFIESGLSLSQREVVDLIHHNRYSVIYKSRQDGISTALNLYLLWRMIETPGIRIALFTYKMESNTREMFRQNINWNLSRFGLNVTPERHNIDRTILGNGSKIFYYSFNSKQPFHGKVFDIVVFEDFFESTDIENSHIDSYKYYTLVHDCMYSTHPVNGKIIISTMDYTINTGDKMQWFRCLPFQEVYGHFFNGKREVLIEKFITHKTS